MGKYNLIAAFYDTLDYFWEKTRYQKVRKHLWKHVKGKRILDAGVGTGRNIPYYPRAEMYAIDNSAAMLARAKKRAQNVTLERMDLTALTFPNNYFDSVVSTFVLCVIPPEQEEQAIKEIKRVLNKGGALITLDYIYSSNPVRKFFQQLTKPLVHALYGLHYDNPTYELINQHFTIKKIHMHSTTLRMIIATK